MTRCTLFHILAAALAMSACTKADEQYSNEPCYLVFDNSTHQNTTLATAMDPMSPGVFCHISTTVRSGATYFVFANNHGLSSESIANAIDQQRTRRLGRRNGLIVGYGNADIVNPVFYAYDAQCPACYSGTGLIDRTLSIGNDGQATCSNCNRSYDLNNGGIISSGSQDGDNSSRLVRYRATTTGAYGVLTVSN